VLNVRYGYNRFIRFTDERRKTRLRSHLFSASPRAYNNLISPVHSALPAL